MQFVGRVAVITGAGGGLGREYALALGKRGAMVVVNDFREGTDETWKIMADKVVKEIRDYGGKAVANYDSVEHGHKLIDTAIDNFGRIDILVNNEGNVRARSMTTITDDEWDAANRVHLRGCYKMARAAWKHFREQNYGRIIVNSANIGRYGYLGHANYSAARMGLLGLTKTVAGEGATYGIMCNAILPITGSELLEGRLPEEFIKTLKAKYIAPIALYLCHETCRSSGDMYMSVGGVVKKLRLQMSDGYQFLKYGEDFGPEHIEKHWEDIETFGTEEMPEDENQLVVELARNGVSEHGTEKLTSDSRTNVLEEMIGKQLTLSYYTYTFKEAILYAFSVGATLSESDTSNLKFLYDDDKEFSVLPTFGVVPAVITLQGCWDVIFSNAGYPMSLAMLGGHYLELFAPLPSAGKLKTTGKIVDVLDKGKGALVVIDAETVNEKNELIVYNQFSMFLLGGGNFGGKRKSTIEKKVVDPPQRRPDYIVEEVVPTSQAVLYRLNQDMNPHNIDPEVAKMAGFKAPFLQGQCTYGYAARHILKTVAGNDVSKFRCINARFSAPVFPGQTLITQMWVEGKRVHFEVLVKETKEKAITKAYLDLNDINVEALR